MPLLINKDWLEAAIQDAEVYESVSVEAAYSGRCMFGRQCLALVSDTEGHAYSVFIYLATRRAEYELIENSDLSEPLFDVEDLAEMLRSARRDNLGRSAVVYWPEVELFDTEADA